MWYAFDEGKDAICENSTLEGLHRDIRQHYRGKAMDTDSDEWQADGWIRTIDQHGDVVNSIPHYVSGNVPIRQRLSYGATAED